MCLSYKGREGIEPNQVRFEVFTAVTMKNAVFWDVTPCGSCKNRYFRGTYRLHLQGDTNTSLPSSQRRYATRRMRKSDSCNGNSTVDIIYQHPITRHVIYCLCAPFGTQRSFVKIY
jgi:hypothetical protein